MKELKEKTQKVLKILLAIFVTFVSLNLSGFDTIEAASSLVAETTITSSTLMVENATVSGLSDTPDIYQIILGGADAFCMDSDSYLNKTTPYTLGGTIDDPEIIQVLNWYSAYPSPTRYAVTQAYIWAIENNVSGSYDATVQSVLIHFGWSFQEIAQLGGVSYFTDGIDDFPTTGTYSWYTTNTDGYQRLAMADTPYLDIPKIETSSVSQNVEVDANEEVEIQINKTDVDTGNSLSGVEFSIYMDDEYVTKVTTNSSGYASYTIENEYSASGSASITYVSNYADLSVENQEYVRNNYDYYTLASATSAALAQATANANASLSGSGESHTYEIIETNTKTGYVLDSTTNTYTRTGSTTITLNATNAQQTGSVTITKLDRDTGVGLSGAIYGIYASTAIASADGSGTLYSANELVATMPATNSSGTSTYSGLALGSYYVKEITAPTGYYNDGATTSFTLTYKGQDYSITDTQYLNVYNDAQLGSITITKLDSDTNNALSGATYGLYAYSDIQYPDGSGVAHSAGTLVATFNATNSSGYASLSNLYLGEYYIKEITAPTDYVLNTSTYRVSLTYKGQSYSVTDTQSQTVTDDSQRGSVTMTKYDSESGNTVAGAIYGIYALNDIVHPDGTTGTLYIANELVATMPATNSSGQATVSDLYLGDYYIKEITSPEGYVLNEETYEFSLTYKGQSYSVTDTQYVSGEDTPQRVEVSLDKYDTGMYSYVSGDSDNPDIVDYNNDGAQGDATIEGATYGLYASSDITYFDTTGATVIYNSTAGSDNEITLLEGTDLVVYTTSATAGTLLATAKTNEDGEITFGNLYNGEYYVVELEAPEGYLLNSDTYSLDGTWNVSSQDETTIYDQTNVYDTVIKQAFEISKYGTNSSSGSVLIPLEGVEFEVQLESDIQALIEEGYTLSEAKELAPVYDTLVTDYLGNDTSIELPYGTYRITETKTIGEYYFAEDFFITIENDSRTPLEHELYATVINYEFEAMIQVVKQDVDSGKQVALSGAQYMVKNLDTGLYIGYWDYVSYPHSYVTTFTTNVEGYLFIASTFPVGTYQLEEVNAPYGYTLDTNPIVFEVTSKALVTMAPDGTTPVITVVQENDAVEGVISVYKEGEALVGYEDDFIYEVLPLEGASYEIYARNDIMDPSNDGTVLYEADTLIETITTGKDGYATSSNLYLGDYYVVECDAPDGYVVSEETQEVTLSYEDQYTEVVYESVSYTNERQTIEMSVFKQDEDTQVLISGAEFTLYANKDIYNYYGDLIVEAGTELETVTSDSEGKVSFTLDLPIDLSEIVDTSENETIDEDGYTLIGDQDSLFKLIETKAPTGYQPKDVIYFVGTRSVDEITIQYEPTATFENEITKVYFDKVDTNEEYLSGSLLQVIEVVEGKEVIIDEWISSDETYVIEGLEIDHTYYLREVSATTGYTVATDIEFTVDAYNNEKVITMTNGSVEVAKYDSTTTTLLADATFEVYQVTDAGEILVDTFTTDGETTYFVNNLVVGNQYIIRELDTPTGFVTMEDMRFTVISNEDMYIELGNTTYVDIYKVDADTQALLSGATLELYTFDNEGKEVIIDTFISTNEYYHVEGLVNGQTYYLREVEAPEGYYFSDEVIEFTIGSDINVVFENEIVTTEFIKIDSYSEEKVTGAILEVYEVLEDGTENSIEVFTTGEENHIIKGLIEGNTYYLREVEAPEGYYFTEEVVAFIAGTDTFVTLENAPILTSIQVNKVDSQTGEAIISKDFVFTLYSDADCTEVLAVVDANTVDGTATFENIYYGTYYIKETSAPFGYKLSDEVKVVVIDDLTEGVGDVYSFEYQNTLLPIVVTGDVNSSIALYSALVLVAGISLLVNRKNRRKEG